MNIHIVKAYVDETIVIVRMNVIVYVKVNMIAKVNGKLSIKIIRKGGV